MEFSHGINNSYPGFGNPGSSTYPGVNNYMTSNSFHNSNLSRQSPFTSLAKFESQPPLPPRPRNTNNNYSMNYGNSYNSYGGYGGYGGYGLGNYGSYGMGYSGYNRFGMGTPGYGMGYGYGNSYGPENRLVQLAQESSRPAFQSIQSVVNTFGSVTMMLESTFHAFHSSFLAVLGVADNFGRLRSMFGHLFSTFALFKFINWCIKKLLFLIGLKNSDPTVEKVWKDNMNGAEGVSGKCAGPNLPLLTFLGVVMTAPYLIYKLLSTLQPSLDDTWNPEDNPGALAVGFYDFNAESEQELSFGNRQKLMLAPKKYQKTDGSGWLLACDEGKKLGLVPVNYIGIIVPSDKQRPGHIEHNGQTFPISLLETGQHQQQTNQHDTKLNKNENLNQVKTSIDDTNNS